MVNHFSLFFPRITTKEKRELVYHASKVRPNTRQYRQAQPTLSRRRFVSIILIVLF